MAIFIIDSETLSSSKSSLFSTPNLSAYSSKNLIEQIITTRRVVNYYIIWNVLIGGFFGIFGAIDGFNNAYSKDHNVNRTTEYLVIIFIVPLIMVFIWGFYILLYGSLLNKLNNNYKELMKIEL